MTSPNLHGNYSRLKEVSGENNCRGSEMEPYTLLAIVVVFSIGIIGIFMQGCSTLREELH
jgi:hypothetical protein